MRLVEELNVLRYYKPFIEAGGGVKQVRTALRWSEWYAVKWWEEVYSELGLQSIRESVFARALFISLRIRDYVREDGRIKKRREKPEYPTNSYAIEFVELHESFDRIGAVNVAANKADEKHIGHSSLYHAEPRLVQNRQTDLPPPYGDRAVPDHLRTDRKGGPDGHGRDGDLNA
jgi:hypothetical protein